MRGGDGCSGSCAEKIDLHYDRNGSKAVIANPQNLLSCGLPILPTFAGLGRPGVALSQFESLLFPQQAVAAPLWHPSRDGEVDEVGDVYNPRFDTLRGTGVDQAFGNFCFALPQPESSFEPARSISSSASRIEKSAPDLNLSSSSHATGAATGAPFLARAE